MVGISVFNFALRTSVTRRDDGTLSYAITPSARVNWTLPLGLRSALVLVGGASYVIGQPLATELTSLGGRFYLRGYDADELIGRGNVFGVAELRFTPTIFSDLAINALHIAWLRQIQLAAFVGGGVLFSPRDDERDQRFAAEVGGGVRIHFDYGGVQPGVLVFDVARPLVRDSEDRARRRPITAFVAFEQYY